MQTDRSILGDCPHCETTIGSRHVLIEYRTDGRQRFWAECPKCAEVVDPL